MTKLGFIGMGNMAGAILRGVVAAKLELEIFGFDTDFHKLEEMKPLGVIPCADSIEVFKEAEAVIFAVKPQSVPSLLAEVKGCVKNGQLIISIAAGITPDYITKSLGASVRVIQAMPNTPLMLSCGATALARGEGVTDKDFEFVKSIFESAGIAEEIPLSRMNESIPINGSSPAFIYEYAAEFIKYGESNGLSAEVCLRLFAQTLVGSAKMLTESGLSVDQLIDMVSSKGGTTIEGLKALRENNGLNNVVTAACERCVKRAYELSESFSST